MCCISGFVGHVREGDWEQTYRIVSRLLVHGQRRGDHATGFAAATEPYDQPFNKQLIVAKWPCAAETFVRANHEWRALRHRRCSMILAHNRFATHGSPLLPQNNHPHVSKMKGLALIHNGMITDHRQLAERHHVTLRGDCDSECLLRIIERASYPIHGLTTCLREAEGSMAVAVYDSTRDLVYLCRNSGRPLWIARLMRDRRWFFASTDQILLSALSDVLGKDRLNELDVLMPVPEDVVLTLTGDGRLLTADSASVRRAS